MVCVEVPHTYLAPILIGKSMMFITRTGYRTECHDDPPPVKVKRKLGRPWWKFW